MVVSGGVEGSSDWILPPHLAEAVGADDEVDYGRSTKLGHTNLPTT